MTMTPSVITPATPITTASSGIVRAPMATITVRTTTRDDADVTDRTHPLLLGGDGALWILAAETSAKPRQKSG
jgi:hypothetical protein